MHSDVVVEVNAEAVKLGWRRAILKTLFGVVVVVVVVVVVAVVVIVVVVVGGAATGSADVRTSQRLPNTNGQSLVDVNNDWCWCSLFRDGRGVLRDDGTTSSVLLLPKAAKRRKAL